MEPSAFTFMFDEDSTAIQGSLGRSPLEAILNVTLRQFRSTSFRVRRGSLLLHFRSLRPSGVTIEDGRFGKSISRTSEADPALRRLLIWELSDSIAEGWTTTSDEDLPLLIGSHNIYLVSVWPLHRAMAEAFDESVKGPAYLGAAEIDPGNPLQRDLLWDSLYDDLYFDAGGLFHDDHWLAPEERHELNGHGEWWDALDFDEVSWHQDRRTGTKPPPLSEVPLSRRGRTTAERLEAREIPSHLERVVEGLAYGPNDEAVPTTLSVLPNSAHATIDPLKLTDYTLNTSHKDGGAKAKLFAEKLGITASDWRFLEAQIRHGLTMARVHRVRSESWGVKYHADMAIVGKNDAVAVVRTAWIIAGTDPPRLVTTYIAPRDVAVKSLPPPVRPPVIDEMNNRDDDWHKLHELAAEWGTSAALSTVPTPMYVDGRGYPEGLVGSAYVTVKDARRGFARWLIKRRHADLGPYGGAVIGSPRECGTSAERAAAWAESYLAVLRLNGVEGDVRRYLS